MNSTFDEFGNLLADDSESDQLESDDEPFQDQVQRQEEPQKLNEQVTLSTNTSIVQRSRFPTAEEVFAGVEVMVQDEDEQGLDEPIIAPLVTKSFDFVNEDSSKLPSSTFSPKLIRNVCFAGNLHSGKTSIFDFILKNAYEDTLNPRFTDTRKDEQTRALSIKPTPISVVLQTDNGKSFLLNLIDTPGHPNFFDEALVTLRVSDGLVLVIDAAEGVVMHSYLEKLIRAAVMDGVPIILLLSKLDRFVVELKLPPKDAYFKLFEVIGSINSIIQQCAMSLGRGPNEYPILSPVTGNVLFSSAQHGYLFSLHSFAKFYAQTNNLSIDTDQFARKLWGDYFYEESTGRFLRKSQFSNKRTFVEFVLNMIYKVTSYVVSETEEVVQKEILKPLHITFPPSLYHKIEASPRDLIPLIFSAILGTSTPLVDSLVTHFPPPCGNPSSSVITFPITRTLSHYPSQTDSFASNLMSMDKDSPLIIDIVKLYPILSTSQESTSISTRFHSYGRICTGTATVGQTVWVLGEGYSADGDVESAIQCTITNILFPSGRHHFSTTHAGPGNLVMLDGIDLSITGPCTVVGIDVTDPDLPHPHPLMPIRSPIHPTLKISIEPLHPRDLPKMTEGLRSVRKTYAGLQMKVEESGEHVLVGTGELMLDCVMFDLREVYSKVEIKVSDPIVPLCETAGAEGRGAGVPCKAQTANGKNTMTVVAQHIEAGLETDVKEGRVVMEEKNDGEGRVVSSLTKMSVEYLQKAYKMDRLGAMSIVAIGPTADGSNILTNDTLPSFISNPSTLQENLKNTSAVLPSLTHAFKWTCREGPLCSEPIRQVNFRLIDTNIDKTPAFRFSTQIVPAMKRACSASLLLSSPILMEPILMASIVTPPDCVSAVETVLSRRRGHVTSRRALPGNPLTELEAFIPSLESVGFETDLRQYTQGQAFVLTIFDHWEKVPGDPLDESVTIIPLKPSDLDALARELTIKTRRRKGLSESVAASKYFDATMLSELEKSNTDVSFLS
ncbi:putative 110 kDa U5 small nuclear ribonucleoprotein component CLO [Blattamonas nauphoetae]|uniref:110 kDa U5 small nuclear ribonucleoprotein component CLO n=1 Tax=Blattamonas nauphoetae TaxID=2049346 RepID=A0ABQ9YM29_9EUKA|nr:putative 110 kDa U5 small nuclear ribonucleoprotein component CLO [Blattamonas nauphoetae]